MKTYYKTAVIKTDTPEVVIADITLITRYYPWWDIFCCHSTGYDKITGEVYRDWYSNCWSYDSLQGGVLPVELWSWLDVELMKDRLERAKKLVKK